LNAPSRGSKVTLKKTIKWKEEKWTMKKKKNN